MALPTITKSKSLTCQYLDSNINTFCNVMLFGIMCYGILALYLYVYFEDMYEFEGYQVYVKRITQDDVLEQLVYGDRSSYPIVEVFHSQYDVLSKDSDLKDVGWYLDQNGLIWKFTTPNTYQLPFEMSDDSRKFDYFDSRYVSKTLQGSIRFETVRKMKELIKNIHNNPPPNVWYMYHTAESDNHNVSVVHGYIWDSDYQFATEVTVEDDKRSLYYSNQAKMMKQLLYVIQYNTNHDIYWYHY